MKISQILPKESGSKRKNYTQQEYFWHLNTQPEGVPEVKKGSKGRHIPTDSDRRSAPPPTKFWLAFGHRLPKLVANISSQFHHLVNLGLTVGCLDKWLPIKTANPSKIDKFEWFIARRLQMAPSDCNHL